MLLLNKQINETFVNGIFLSGWLAEFRNSYWVLLFSWQHNHLHRFNMNLSSVLAGILKTVAMQPWYFLECLFENDTHIIRYDQTHGRNQGWLYGTMFIEPSWENRPRSRHKKFPVLQVSVEGHFLARWRNVEYFEGPPKRRTSPKWLDNTG